ncbi:leucine-rich_repeat domain-containing protein [Hexamita inflata]|uniref:Leucine-rich_repeat domain-containing protein n=1 Tax=Hexamita inflata TaxID=28002 RepID=A0ABP1I168_9EUKA
MLPHIFPRTENVNDNSLILSDELQTLSEWDWAMIKSYQNQIKDEALRIQSNQDLQNLEFIRFFKITELQLYDCKNIIPKLKNRTIKQLRLNDCDIFSVKDFHLENLEMLHFTNLSRQQKQNKLVQEILQFKKLKSVYLFSFKIVDVSPLSQMTGLTALCLEDCDIRSTEALRPLINLTQLFLDNNKKVDITFIQYLTKLYVLELKSCNLVSIDVLRPLTKLEVLTISTNSKGPPGEGAPLDFFNLSFTIFLLSIYSLGGPYITTSNNPKATTKNQLIFFSFLKSQFFEVSQNSHKIQLQVTYYFLTFQAIFNTIIHFIFNSQLHFSISYIVSLLIISQINITRVYCIIT